MRPVKAAERLQLSHCTQEALWSPAPLKLNHSLSFELRFNLQNAFFHRVSNLTLTESLWNERRCRSPYFIDEERIQSY